MIDKNETLEYRAEQNNIIGQVIELPSGKVLPDWKQDIFYDLHDLSGEAYQFELSKLRLYIRWDTNPTGRIKKVNWVMKTKLTSHD